MGLLGMAVMVVAVEAAVMPRWREFSDPVSLNWQFADQSARREARGCDVLLLGDSLVKHGLIPSLLRDEAGLKSVNLSAARGPALLTYYVLRRALESGARPSAIVIDTKPAILIGGVDYNARYWPSMLTAAECVELGWITGKGALGLSMLTARLLPTLRSRLEIRAGVLAALTQEPDRMAAINRMLWRNWTVNDGANVAMLDSTYRGTLSPDIQEKLHPDRWYVDSANTMGIERLLDLARSRGIRVFWLLPPISTGLQEWRERSGSEAKYEQFVRGFRDRYPDIVNVLDARRIARSASLYVDATHLSGRGGVLLSRAVGTVVARELAVSRGQESDGWIILEEPPAAPEPPLEDVEASKRILGELP